MKKKQIALVLTLVTLSYICGVLNPIEIKFDMKVNTKLLFLPEDESLKGVTEVAINDKRLDYVLGKNDDGSITVSSLEDNDAFAGLETE